MSDGIPDIDIEPARRSFFERASIVWLVPVAAMLIAVGIALNSWRDRGPVIEISFPDAGGIVANETLLKFRNVSVGLVEKIRFSENLDKVIASVRVNKAIAPYVDDDARFWVVQPEVTTSGVSGLETVLSGVYIEGTWNSEANGTVYAFDGLEEAPLTAEGREGLTIELRTSADSGMTELTPVLYKGIQVGKIGKARISNDGRWVFADAIIYAPHDRLVTTATRFWDTSGFRFSIGPAGAELDFNSVASLIAGGITFDTLVSGGQVTPEGAVFEVFPDEATARRSVFAENDGSEVRLAMIFDENVSGLAAGAPVEWRGVSIGEVVGVTGLIDRTRFGDSRVRLQASVEIKPGRMGLDGTVGEAEALEFLNQRAGEGLRARLVSASILTGGLKIELLNVEDGPVELIAYPENSLPVFPVTKSEIADVTATAEGVFERLNALPVEELLASAISFLDNATAFVTSEDMRETPGELRGLLADARGVVGSPEVQALPGDVSAALGDIRSAAADLSALLDTFRQADAANRTLAAIDNAAAAAKAAETALAGLPELTAKIDALVAKATALPLEDLTAEATGLAGDLRALAGSDATQALPGRIAEAVASLTTILDEIARAGTVQQASETLAAAQSAVAAFETSIAGVPGFVERIDRIAANAEAVKLDQLAEDLSGVLATARTLFGDAGEAQLPSALADAFRELDLALAEMREGGLVANANATLGSTREAAAAVAEAADALPALVTRIETALRQTQETLAAYDGNSTFSRELSEALRDVQRAAQSVDSLSRALERRPNSIILGR